MSVPVAAGLDMAKAPPAFGYRNAMVVPVDFETMHIDYSFNTQTSTATARAELVFSMGEVGGFPLMDLVPNPTSVTLDGAAVDPADFPVIDDPHVVTKFRVLRKNLDPSTTHTLQVEYSLSSSDVTFTSGRVRVGFFMSDLATGGREFFEQYGPANYEFDNLKATMSFSVTGTSVEHEIFTNGDITGQSLNSWRVEFPEYFNTSAFYFHLSEKGRFDVSRYTFAGNAREIPVTVYSTTSSLTASAVTRSRQVLAELEGTYGAFAHDKVVIYVTPDGGGMEHCGATMTSLSALGHELTHSYFARGVMPANGNAGWIDEAIASWRDNGYPRASSAPNRSAVNLGGFSSYRRHTTRDAYTLGAKLISEFDRMFSGQGGMKAVLKDLFAEAKHTTITVHDFKAFLERTTGQNLQSVFDRYVFGKTTKGQIGEQTVADNFGFVNYHPRPYTKEELAIYR
jgi:hypothetical protein